MSKAHPYSFGIEEEFFLVDAHTFELATSVPHSFFDACRRRLGGAVHREMKQAQVEIATPVLNRHGEARTQLVAHRAGLSEVAAAFGLRAIAAGTHPLGGWETQANSEGERYDRLIEDFQIVGRRNLVSGCHVHVAVPVEVDRVELMNRLMPWTPLLLALSASSPFWRGRATGLASYRQCAYDEWPRSGIPDAFADEAQYRDFIELLTACGALDDGSFLWWAVRPSTKYPTLELRITDACTRIDDALAVAAAFRCLVRAHVRNPDLGARSTAMTRRIVDENRWRAKRFGARAFFIDEA